MAARGVVCTAADCRASSADLEASRSFDLPDRDPDTLDARITGTLTTPRTHRVDGVWLALEDRVDSAVAAIAHPPRYATTLGLPATRVTEEHSLDVPADDDMTTDHVSTVASSDIT